jgi:RNA recognition motif-containing protein
VLFVRNIGFETTEAQFREFMQKFGPVDYALLCKTHSKSSEEGVGDVASHKGTGFVRFKKEETASQLLELSRKVEEQLDEERKNSRLQQKSKSELVSSLSLLKNEIELNGRRLIVKESVSKQEAKKIKEN